MTKVDAATMVCREHQVHGCVVCMVDDLWAWDDARKAKRQQLKREWRETPIEERFDIGGEA